MVSSIRDPHFASGELSFLLTDSWHCKGDPYHYWGHDGGVRGLCRAVEHIKRLPPKSINGKQVFEWANEGDSEVCEALDAYTYRLAMQFFNLQSLFDPDDCRWRRDQCSAAVIPVYRTEYGLSGRASADASDHSESRSLSFYE